MINDILVTSTSFVLSKNPAWEKLGLNIDFSYVNNLEKGLLSNQNKPVVALIFLQDLVDNFSNNSNNLNDISNSIAFLINKRLCKNSEPLIVLISKFSFENSIRRAFDNNKMNKIYEKILKILRKFQKIKENLYIVELDYDFSKIGFLNCFDKRNWYLANCRLSLSGLDELISSLSKIVLRINKTPHKVLVLDCDNTLWGGIVGEDGLEGLDIGQDGLGKAFLDFQKIIKKLKHEGVILAVCSKNNISDVLKVFTKHKSMFLKKKDILTFKVNWNEKYLNIKQIANELDLSLKSFVFWDDNPIEREKVRLNLPEVLVVDPPEEVQYWADTLFNIDEFAKFQITKEDKKKQKQYIIRNKFQKSFKNAKNIRNYLKSIKLKPKLIKIDKSTQDRAHQLIMKTNQFNLRTERMSIENFKKFISDKETISFLVSLKDIYGDHGIVGLLMAKKFKDKSIFINNFILSCRILGRDLDEWMIKQLINICNKQKKKSIYAEYISTERNIMTSDLFEKYGFKILKKDKKKKFYFSKLNKINLKNVEVYD
jgi:FkbH-like protein